MQEDQHINNTISPSLQHSFILRTPERMNSALADEFKEATQHDIDEYLQHDIDEYLQHEFKEPIQPEFKEPIQPEFKEASQSDIDEYIQQSLQPSDDKEPSKRGRKRKYNTDEERIQARRMQQREYRKRKKQELETLRNIVANIPPGVRLQK